MLLTMALKKQSEVRRLCIAATKDEFGLGGAVDKKHHHGVWRFIL